MKIRQLEALVALVECGTVSDAATQLKTPQPNLSRLLMALEDQYSPHLFDRTGNKINISPLGLKLYRRAKTILAEVKASKTDLSSFNDNGIESVRVNCAPIVIEELLPSVVTHMQRQGCGNNINLIGSSEDGPEMRIESLKNGDCDIVVTLADEISDKSGLEQRNLLSLKICVLASKGHPATKMSEPTVKMLSQYDWVLISRNGKVAIAVSRAFQSAGFEIPPRTLLVSNRTMILSLLSKGEYLSPMLYSERFTSDRFQNLEVINLAGLDTSFPIAMFTRTNYLPAEAAQSMIEGLINLGG